MKYIDSISWIGTMYRVDYYNGNHYDNMRFMYYTKREALQRVRELLGIKRNPRHITDYTRNER